MPFVLYRSILSGASLNQKMLLYRRGLNVKRPRLPDTAWGNVLAIKSSKFMGSLARRLQLRV